MIKVWWERLEHEIKNHHQGKGPSILSGGRPTSSKFRFFHQDDGVLGKSSGMRGKLGEQAKEYFVK